MTISGGGTSGVLAIDGSGAHLDVTLVFLRVHDGSAPAGGAIAAVDADLHVIVCDLGTNEAVDGGAISAVGVDLTVVNTIFQDNHVVGHWGRHRPPGPDSARHDDRLQLSSGTRRRRVAASRPGRAPVTSTSPARTSTATRRRTTEAGSLSVQPSLLVTLHDTAIYDNTAGDTRGAGSWSTPRPAR